MSLSQYLDEHQIAEINHVLHRIYGEYKDCYHVTFVEIKNTDWRGPVYTNNKYLWSNGIWRYTLYTQNTEQQPLARDEYIPDRVYWTPKNPWSEITKWSKIHKWNKFFDFYTPNLPGCNHIFEHYIKPKHKPLQPRLKKHKVSYKQTVRITRESSVERCEYFQMTYQFNNGGWKLLIQPEHHDFWREYMDECLKRSGVNDFGEFIEKRAECDRKNVYLYVIKLLTEESKSDWSAGPIFEGQENKISEGVVETTLTLEVIKNVYPHVLVTEDEAVVGQPKDIEYEYVYYRQIERTKLDPDKEDKKYKYPIYDSAGYERYYDYLYESREFCPIERQMGKDKYECDSRKIWWRDKTVGYDDNKWETVKGVNVDLIFYASKANIWAAKHPWIYGMHVIITEMKNHAWEVKETYHHKKTKVEETGKLMKINETTLILHCRKRKQK